ncbi:LysE family transporter [Cellulosimicrobium cellulans]|uniref:LysE family transporter n=1 Tax=Cellulosimicrobium cellulans TaxID=1710 RepID=UPI001EDC5939|nr:LysE family transporter [Cellulosimicrobium cellulans]UKJ65087.1 LysE family transporter [Cellulosimicrobium cellulans]
MDLVTALGAGAVAGLALAVPLGAVGVLLIQEGASRGWAKGVPAAVAVATVDMLYGIVVVSAGAVVAPVVASWAPWPRIVGGGALVMVAAWNLVRAGRPNSGGKDGTELRRAPSSHRYALFFGLTAANPATLVYFAAIVTALPAVSTSLGAAALFVAGVALASLGWQLLLVLVGVVVRRKVGPRLGHLTMLVGNGTIAVLGVLMVTGSTF